MGRFISHLARWATASKSTPARWWVSACFRPRHGVVVGRPPVIGDGCTIYQGVTLGGTLVYKLGAKRHPTLGKDVVVSAGAKVLGGFEVGDGAKIGSNAVVIKPVPAGATAVGIPARIIPSKRARAPPTEADQSSPPTALRREDDPVSQALRGLIDSASGQEHQIALLWKAIETLSPSSTHRVAYLAMPRQEHFETDKLNELVGKITGYWAGADRALGRNALHTASWVSRYGPPIRSMQ